MIPRPAVLLLAFVVATGVLATGGLATGEDVFHGGDVIYVKPLKAVLFSHKSHVEETGLSCDMCHAGLFQMQSLEAQKDPEFTMAGLYEGKYCGACHMKDSMAFASNTQCARCHIGVKGFNQLTGVEKKTEGH